MTKFAAQDAGYLARRTEYAEALGPQKLWDVMDAWPLFVGIANLARYLSLAELLEQTRPVAGDVVEVGCWRGASLLFFAKLLALWDPHGPKMVHGFDKWETGFEANQFTARDNQEVAPMYTGRYSGNLETIRHMLTLYHLGDSVELHRGLVEETWPALLKQDPGFRVSFCFLDLPLYAPTATVLATLHERLSPGGLIVFNNYHFADWPGETQAADEFVENCGQWYDVVGTPPHTRQPSLVLRKRANG